MPVQFQKDLQYVKFCAYGFLKNLDFFDPFLILFFRSKGLSFVEIGSLYAFREIIINIFEIPTGMLADTLGRRRTLASAFGFYILSFLIFYFSGSFWFFILAMVFYGYGDAFRTGTHKAMIFEYLKIKGWQSQKVHYYGHTRSWSQTGSAVSALLAGALVFITGNYSMVFLFAVIPYLIDMVLVLSYPAALDGQGTDGAGQPLLKRFGQTFRDFVYSIKNPRVLRAILSQAVYTGYYKAIRHYLQPVLKALALSLPIMLTYQDEKRAAVVVGVIYFFIYLLTSRMARHSGRFTEKFPNLAVAMNITMGAGLFLGLISGVLFHVEWMVLSVVFFISIYLVENLRKPIGISIVADELDRDILATALSAESQAETLVAAVFAVVLGFLADYAGVGMAVAVVSLLALAGIPFYRARSHKTG